jgi:hypothetical protein
MAGPNIYPSIPAPGNTIDTITPCLNAMRQSLTMLILNAQNPNPNYTPSTAAQIFVTRANLQAVGLLNQQGSANVPTEAPMDGKKYVRQNGVWVPE